VIDAMRNRLPDGHGRAGQHGQIFTERRQQFCLAAILHLEARLDLRRIDLLRVRITGRSARASRGLHDLRVRQHDLLDASRNLVRRFERRPRHRHDVDRQAALVEVRQERAPGQHEAHDRGRERRGRCNRHQTTMTQQPIERC
jgi:hypothetical protein